MAGEPLPARGALPPVGRLRRTIRLATLPAEFAARSAVGLGRRLCGRLVEVVAAQVQQATAEQLFATLGELKGGAMKVGQHCRRERPPCLSTCWAAYPG